MGCIAISKTLALRHGIGSGLCSCAWFAYKEGLMQRGPENGRPAAECLGMPARLLAVAEEEEASATLTASPALRVRAEETGGEARRPWRLWPAGPDCPDLQSVLESITPYADRRIK